MRKLPVVLLLAPMAVWAQDLEQLANEKPFDWKGSVGGSLNGYGVSGIAPRSNPYFWNLYGNFTGRIYGIDLPFSYTIGKQEQDYTLPYFQMGASPSYKWARAHVGVRNMRFSRFTLDNHVFTGGGLELTPKKFRFAAMGGILRPAREYDPTVESTFYTAQFKRIGYGAKIGVGTEESYVDLIFFAAKDVENSIQSIPPDSLLRPASNASLGLDWRWKVSEKITLFTDGALSAFTRNINANAFGAPENPIMPANVSSRLAYALSSGAHYSTTNFNLKLVYERIMPEFESMGIYFLTNDLQKITLAPSFSLMKRKLRLNGSISLQNNNLLNNRMETNQRLIGSGNLSYQPNAKFGVDANFTTFSMEQFENRLVRPDSARIGTVTRTYGITPRLTFFNTEYVNNFLLNLSYTEMNDLNPFTREFTDMQTVNTILNWSQNVIQKSLGFNAALNHTLIRVFNINTARYGLTLGANKSLKENTLSLGIANTFNLTSVEGNSDGFVNSLNATINYTVKEKHNFGFNLNHLLTTSKAFDSFNEFRGGVNYRYTIR